MTGLALRGFATINFWADDVAAARDLVRRTFLVPRRTSSAATPTVGSFTPSFAWVITRLS